MPLLPLPPGGGPLSGGDLPVNEAADVLAALPVTYRDQTTAPIRDAFMDAFAKVFTGYQEQASTATGQCNPLYASDSYLTTIADDHGVVRGTGESDSDLSARIFIAPHIVTPEAILERINAFISPVTTHLAQLVETELDCWFVHDGTVTAWDSFVGPVDPRYPDRYYPDDSVENGGSVLAQNSPGGAIPMHTFGVGRAFLVRVPPLEGADDEFAFIGDANEDSFFGNGADIDGSESDGTDATSVFADQSTATELYSAIIGALDSIKGQGISWSMIVDPGL